MSYNPMDTANRDPQYIQACGEALALKAVWEEVSRRRNRAKGSKRDELTAAMNVAAKKLSVAMDARGEVLTRVLNEFRANLLDSTKTLG
jgi:hypothetical protein